MKTTCSPTFAGLTLNGTLTGQDIIPDGVDTRSLGSATAEWLNLYIGDAGKIYFGLAQDVNLYRDDGRLQTDNDFRIGTATKGLQLRKSGTALDIDGFGAYDIYVNPNETNILRFTTSGIRMVDGKVIEWSDVNLYRKSENVLRTDDVFWIQRGSASANALVTDVDGDTYRRFILDADGKMEWGPGNAARDVKLYRADENVLRTDDAFEVYDGANVRAKITLAGVIQCGHDFKMARTVDGDFVWKRALVPQTTLLVINYAGDFSDGVLIEDPRLYIGATDVNLYRSAANVLKTDDAFEVGGRDVRFPAGGNAYFGSLDTAAGREVWFRTGAPNVRHGFLPDTANEALLGSATYYWRWIYGNYVRYKDLDVFSCAEELSGLPVERRFNTENEAETLLRHEMTKEWLHVKYGKKKGTIVCTCGKEVREPCPEHEDEWRDKYTLKTGDMIIANSKLVLSLLDQIKDLQKKIEKLEARFN